MRRVLLISFVLLVGGTNGPSFANTLDPSHPVWQGVHASQWESVLSERPLAVPALHVSTSDGLGKALTASGMRVLVVPVLFEGQSTETVARTDLDERWFADDESSVRGYWDFASGGALQLSGRVLPWTQVDGTLARDYLNVLDGAPLPNLDAGPRALARVAVARAAQLLDLSSFDDDGPDGVPGSGDDDGTIDLLVVVHAGEGWETSLTATGPAIVSLQGRLRGESVAGSDLAVDAFAVVSARGPLGVWAHEFGHLLGLEDLYDFDRASLPGTPGGSAPQGGLGIWSLMASGTWGGAGALPSNLDAWSRRLLGFGDARVVDEATVTTLVPPTADSSESIEVRALGDWGSERWLLENRRARSASIVDGGLPGSGVLVYRVRDDLARNSFAQGRWISVVQADGLDEIGAGIDDGDDGDVWDGSPGRSRLDASTNPDTQSVEPDPSRTPPAFSFFPAFEDGSTPVQIDLAEGSALRLQSASFEASGGERRTFLNAGERARLVVRLADVGSETSSDAQLTVRLAAGSRAASVEPSTALDLSLSDGTWGHAAPLWIEDLDAFDDRTPVLLELEITSSGGASRIVPLGIPISNFGGLGRGALLHFTPQVLDPSGQTVFTRLDFAQLPRPADVGWALTTNGVETYANNVDVALLGPWMAAPADGRVDLYSSHQTETSLPGQAFDGGVLEAWVPDRGWTTLAPKGGPVVHVVRRSEAAVHDRLGFGGEDTPWSGYHATLPDELLPMRLRLRFASDGDRTGRGWSVAGLRTNDDAVRAVIEVEERADGSLLGTASLSGDMTGITSLRYEWRRPGSTSWSPASNPFSAAEGSTPRVPLFVPEEVSIATLGLFAEVPDGFAPMLLGEGGLRRASRTVALSVLGNPSPAPFILRVDTGGRDLTVRIHDVRGRLVRELPAPAGVDWVEWDGRDAEGSNVASGRYFAALDGPDPRHVTFVLVR